MPIIADLVDEEKEIPSKKKDQNRGSSLELTTTTCK